MFFRTLLIGLLFTLAVPLRGADPQPLPSAELHHLYRLSDRLYSGAQPEGEAGFAELERLGVKTILSVDGARTDVELAKRHGMRYVHCPFGYEGIGSERALEIAKAAATLEGPLYVHCHHGKHRGPAAVAIVGIALEDWSLTKATRWMQQAGTSPNYKGLYRSVQQFQKPTAEQLQAQASDFPSQVKPASFVEAMVAISLTHDRLKQLAADGYRTPASNPDLTAPHEALQLNEHYRELVRTKEFQQQDDDLQQLMHAAQEQSERLHAVLKQLEQVQGGPNSDLRQQADRALGMASENCKTCHASFRDTRTVK